MTKLLSIDNIDSFIKVRDIKEDEVNPSVIKSVQALNEKTELEPFIRQCIYDFNDTPHGPTEITDILTVKTKVKASDAYSAFILKGKSFKTVKAQDVAHQIYRLTKISGLDLAIFAYTGNVLDQVTEQFVSTCKEIDCYYSLWSSLEIARLFIAFGILCPKDGNIIENGKCVCGYTPPKEELNIFQKQALNELNTSHKLMLKGGLVVLPTGTGKTRIAVLDIKNNKFQNVLYIAHTKEILDDAEKEFLNFFHKNDLHRITSEEDFLTRKRISFCTIQLISNHKNKLSEDLYDYVVVDEFHHGAAKTYKSLIDYFDYQFLLGLTATPFRGDRKDISELCNGNYIISVELRQAIEAGILSPYNYYGCFDDIDYTKIKHDGEKYDVKDLERNLIIPKRDLAIFSKWSELADDKSTIGFCCTKKHAKRCADYFNQNGIKSDVYLSDTPNREQILKNFNSGEIKVLFAVDVLNEGINLPFVECLLFLRPTESKRVFLQQLGRGLRKYPGKFKTIVLDFIGNFSNAYRIVEYLGLSEFEDDDSAIFGFRFKSTKELFNLPLDCEIHFDDRVIDIFSNQVYSNLKNITRFNITRILIQQYIKLCVQLGKRANWREIDRNCLLNSEIYKILFQNIKQLHSLLNEDLKNLGI